jgi:branched-chain amino acid transport system substrate-binding protein
MHTHWRDVQSATDIWTQELVTRRRLIGFGATAAGALGATLLVPAPWQQAFGAEEPIKVGGIQPLTGPAASGGLMAKVGQEVAVNRINSMGGVNGRPLELVVEDSEGKPAVGIRKTRKLIERDLIDAGQGGFMSNVCIACMPEYQRAKVVNMIGVCLDTTITTSRCDRYTFRPFDFAPAQAVRHGIFCTSIMPGDSQPVTPIKKALRKAAAKSWAPRAFHLARRTWCPFSARLRAISTVSS